VFSLVAVTALTALLSWPPLSISRRGGSGTPFWLVLYLLPQALAVTIPLGLVFGILLGLRDRTSTTRVKWTITALAIGCSAAAFIIVGWLMPAANQAFRETLFALINGFDGRPQRGMNELTLGDLRLLARDRVVIPLIASRRAFDFHARLALAFAPLVLGLFALGVSSARRRAVGFLTVGVFGLAGCFAYYSLMYYSRAVMYFAPFEVSEHVPPIVAAWIPNLVFLAMTLFLIRRPLAGPKAAFR
jgi:lipopolysaccharide export LptBFGC system permease protein LptF